MRVHGVIAHELALRYEVLGAGAASFAAALAALTRADLERVEVLVTAGSMQMTREAMLALPSLAMISCTGSGFEGVDLAAARALGICVTHSPNANASSVADLALGLLIASVRGIVQSNGALKQGVWLTNADKPWPRVRGLSGRRVGIFGLGAIGTKIARRVEACEMDVGYCNRRPRADVGYPYFASLLDLARWSDVLVVAVRASPVTHHCVGAEVLAALGADGHLINIARGSVIDEPALGMALRNRTIAGAGLDVFEHEPRVPEALLELPNVVLTPHISGATLEAEAAMCELVLANVQAFFSGADLPTPVPGSALSGRRRSAAAIGIRPDSAD